MITEMEKGEVLKLREPLTDEERRKFEAYVAEIFSRLGMNLGTPGTSATPHRWVAALWDMTEGYDGDPKLISTFPAECLTCPENQRSHVVEGPIKFTGLCEHHVLPIHGNAWVGYVTDKKLIGISKLTRIVRVYAKRFTSQERISHEVVDELVKELDPQAAAVYIEAEHFCTQARGVREHSSRTATMAVRGAYYSDPQLSDELRLMIRRRPAEF